MRKIKINDEKFTSSALLSTELEFQDSEKYTEFFKQYNCPSAAKGALVMDVITSLPNFNGNGMAFTAATLRNSYQTMNLSPLDYEHRQEHILGSVVNTEVVDSGDFSILRTFAIAWKARMKDWGIEDLKSLKYSMECFYNDYDFYTKSRGIILKEDAPAEWSEEYASYDWSRPVIDLATGERVILLLGGENGVVEFVGIGVVKNPADKTSETLFAAANQNNEQGGNPNMFTQEDMDKALTELREQLQSEFDVKLSEANVQFEQATASLNDSGVQLQELQAKLAEAEVKVTEFTEKAIAAEAELQKQATAKMVEDRKQVLASKNYPADLVATKEQFLAEASEEAFNAMVSEFEAIAANFKQAAASQRQPQQEFIPNITGGDKDSKLDIKLML